MAFDNFLFFGGSEGAGAGATVGFDPTGLGTGTGTAAAAAAAAPSKASSKRKRDRKRQTSDDDDNGSGVDEADTANGAVEAERALDASGDFDVSAATWAGAGTGTSSVGAAPTAWDFAFGTGTGGVLDFRTTDPYVSPPPHQLEWTGPDLGAKLFYGRREFVAVAQSITTSGQTILVPELWSIVFDYSRCETRVLMVDEASAVYWLPGLSDETEFVELTGKPFGSYLDRA